MKATRISQVRDYNAFMDMNQKFSMEFTTGNGSMTDSLRLKGWVLWQSPLKGDAHDFAKFYPNKAAAEFVLKAMI